MQNELTELTEHANKAILSLENAVRCFADFVVQHPAFSGIVDNYRNFQAKEKSKKALFFGVRPKY